MAEYIEREAAYKSLLQEAAYLCWNLKDAESRGYIGAAQAIRNIPTADVAPVRHGSWLDRGSLSCRCSECGCKNGRETPWCPNCGARMGGGAEDA